MRVAAYVAAASRRVLPVMMSTGRLADLEKRSFLELLEKASVTAEEM